MKAAQPAGLAPAFEARRAGEAVMAVYRFTIHGNPVPKERPRVVKGRAYTPARTVAAEQLVQFCARKARVPRLSGPVRLSLSFYRESAQPCDLDNLVKLVSDAMNTIAWKDDRQVAVLSALKAIDRENPRTEVAIEEITEPARRLVDEIGAYPTDDTAAMVRRVEAAPALDFRSERIVVPPAGRIYCVDVDGRHVYEDDPVFAPVVSRVLRGMR